MKRITMLLMLMAANVHAGICGGDFWATGDALLWRPTVEQVYYAIISDLSTVHLNGRQVELETGYDWGYRIGIRYCLCNQDIGITWASLNTTFGSTVSVVPPNGLYAIDIGSGTTFNNRSPATAFVRHSFNYDVLHGELGLRREKACSRISTRWFGGVTYARIRSRRDIIYSALFTVIEVEDRSDTQGVGPRGGMSFHYALWCGFAFDGTVAGSLLVGSSKGLFSSQTRGATTDMTVHNPSRSSIMPAYDVRIGFSYAADCFCRCRAFASLGYELQYYWKGVQRSFFEHSSFRASNFTANQSFTIDGFYFRLGAAF